MTAPAKPAAIPPANLAETLVEVAVEQEIAIFTALRAGI